jgi:uncharacterized membrane protein YbaN (DUF454 family)
VIPLRAKIMASAIVVPLVGYMLVASPAPTWAMVLTLVLVVWGQVYVWTKPSRPGEIRAPAIDRRTEEAGP